MTMRNCSGFESISAHIADDSEFTKGKTRCKSCTSAYYKAWQAKKKGQAPVDNPDPAPAPVLTTPEPVLTPLGQPESMSHDIGHEYKADPKLVALWTSIVAANDAGEHLVLAMHGPQGSGKTDGAEFLAALAERPMVKIDAKSVIDAEAWFGTRGAVEGSTFYSPSEFVKAIQMRSVVYIDEYTRVSNEVRDVLNPLMDGTRTVLNPITGERIKVHPECIIVLGGNVGFKHTGTFDVDPATTSRLAVFNMGYPVPDLEQSILTEHAGISTDIAAKLVAFATEARGNPTMPSVSTRELVQVAVLTRAGLDLGLAVEAKIIAGASDQGGETSSRARLTTLWGGYANNETVAEEAASEKVECPSCHALDQTLFTNCAGCDTWVAI